MKLTITKCPKCTEVVTGMVDLIPGNANLDTPKRGETDYAGETDVDWDSQSNGLDIALRIVGTVENLNEFALVQCYQGHIWITGIKRQSE